MALQSFNQAAQVVSSWASFISIIYRNPYYTDLLICGTIYFHVTIILVFLQVLCVYLLCVLVSKFSNSSNHQAYPFYLITILSDALYEILK